jgi:molybdenum cofactor cytidylyltransferase
LGDTELKEVKIGAVVLAAGAARRFGRPKQLERWPTPEDPTLMERAVSLALQSGANEVVLVLGNRGREALEIMNSYINPPGTGHISIAIAYNQRWEEGQGFSVAIGVQSLNPEIKGALFFLADQPRLTPQTAQVLYEQFVTLPHPEQAILFPMFEGKRGNPALFGSIYFAELSALTGDSGGREVVKAHPQAVQEVPVNDPGILEDIDTPEDLERLKPH